MYGHRARIGYTSPPFLTETFPCEFYRMVPEGVTLVLATLAIKRLTREETVRSVEMTLEAAREMGRAGVDIVVFGGVPLNLSLGYDGLAETMRRTEDEIGVPVTSSVTAQIDALRAVGAERPVLLHPFADPSGFDTVLCRPLRLRSGRAEGRREDGGGARHVPGGRGREARRGALARPPRRRCDLHPRPPLGHHRHRRDAGTRARRRGDHRHTGDRLAKDEVARLAEALWRDRPGADAIYIPAPHWATIGIVETLERALGVAVRVVRRSPPYRRSSGRRCVAAGSTTGSTATAACCASTRKLASPRGVEPLFSA